MDLNINVRELIHQSAIPVYGITGNIFDLRLTCIGQSSSRADDGHTQIPATIMLGFSGGQTDLATLLDLHSYNNQDSKLRNQTLKILQPHPHPQLTMDNKTLRYFHNDENTQKFLGQPAKITEHIIVMEQAFTIEMHYWELAPHPAWFLLHNKEVLVFGQALGFAKHELFQLFQQCVVVNADEQIIHQYQQELDQYLFHV